MAARSIEFLLNARDNTAFGVKSAEQNLMSFKDKFKAAGESFLGSFGEEAAGKLAKLFIGLHAIHAGLDGVAGVARLFRGETEKAVEAFEKIPVVGRFILRPLHEAYDAITGIKEQEAHLEEIEKDREKTLERTRKILVEIAALTAKNAGNPFEARRITEGEESAKRIADIRNDMSTLRMQLEEAQKKVTRTVSLGVGGQGGVTETKEKDAELASQLRRQLAIKENALKAEIELRKQKQKEISEDEFNENLKRDNEAYKQKIEREARIIEERDKAIEGGKKYADEQKKHQEEAAKSLREIQAETAALEAEAAGKRFEAELIRLRAHFAERIKLAEEAGQKENVAALRRGQELGEQIIKNRAIDQDLKEFFGPVEKKDSSPKAGNPALEARFLQRAPGAVDDRLVRNTMEIAKVNKEQKEKLIQLADLMRELIRGKELQTAIF